VVTDWYGVQGIKRLHLTVPTSCRSIRKLIRGVPIIGEVKYAGTKP